jgi:hypothetical protein
MDATARAELVYEFELVMDALVELGWTPTRVAYKQDEDGRFFAQCTMRYDGLEQEEGVL